ncbi:MAG: hypothetical protein KFB96_24555 [Thiocapsa sp.]|jgi:hypothetical protein|nr:MULTISPECIES: hypothetical protein [unclassified Thiocapsa]QVL48695.1 MAG: hypothetical protein KFB96_24555 [Thiocapsa sp.]
MTPIQETKAYQLNFADGEAKAKAGILSRQPTQRFGPLPTWDEKGL